MTFRPSLIRSIPFWVLFIGSLALVGFGAWMVSTRLGGLEDGIRGQSADAAQQLETTIAAYVSPPAATVGGIILGAGLIGLLLTLAVGAVSTILPRPAVEVVEAIDWTEEADEPVLVDESAVASEPLSEAPDVETPSDAPAPATAEPATSEPTTEQDPTRR